MGELSNRTERTEKKEITQFEKQKIDWRNKKGLVGQQQKIYIPVIRILKEEEKESGAKKVLKEITSEKY